MRIDAFELMYCMRNCWWMNADRRIWTDVSGIADEWIVIAECGWMNADRRIWTDVCGIMDEWKWIDECGWMNVDCCMQINKCVLMNLLTYWIRQDEWGLHDCGLMNSN